MAGYICIAMLEDPPYNMILGKTEEEPDDWLDELPLPSHLLCYEAFKNPDLIFNQFIQSLTVDGITVKTDKAFPARPHEVIRAFNQIRDEVFNGQQANKDDGDVENKERLHELSIDAAKTEHQLALSAKVSTFTPLLETQQCISKNTAKDGIADTDVQLMSTAKTQSTALLLLVRQQLIATLKAKISYLSPPIVVQQRIGKYTVKDSIAEDTETDLMWLRFAYGQAWQNGTSIGNATNVNWNKAFEIVQQFNKQHGYAGHSDWRLPTIGELETLIDCVKGKPCITIDTDVFPNSAQWFWSSSPYAYSNDLAWIVDFRSGYSGDDYKDSYSAVRLVRGNIRGELAVNEFHLNAKA